MSMTETVRLTTSAQRREAILLAAADVFFERGYAATSVDAIVARVVSVQREPY